MAVITIPGMFLTGDHASRPAAADVGSGSLYACSDHALIYQSDGTAWTDWADLTGTAGSVNPGTPFEIDYVQFTSAVNVTATAEGSADTIVTANAESFDGSTIGVIEFYAPRARPAASAGANLEFVLYDGASSIGLLGRIFSAAASSANVAVYLMHRLTPSNASHTYSIRAIVSTGTGVVTGGAGGVGVIMPGFIRISKLTA